MSYNEFDTQQVRIWSTPQLKHSLEIPTPIHCASLPIGLKSLAVDHRANLRVRAFIDNVAEDTEYAAKPVVHIDAWGDTILYHAGCIWLDVCKHDCDFQFGTYATGSMSWNFGKPSVQIKFDKPYTTVPKIVVWLKELDVANSANCRVSASASDITTTGFKLTIKAGGDTTLYKATATWIAHPSNRPNIMSGNFNIADIRPWNQPQLINSKNIKFDKKFECIPRVLVALSGLDVGNNATLRIAANAKDITTEGMTLNIDSWADTTLYWAEASYLAIHDY